MSTRFKFRPVGGLCGGVVATIALSLLIASCGSGGSASNPSAGAGGANNGGNNTGGLNAGGGGTAQAGNNNTGGMLGAGGLLGGVGGTGGMPGGSGGMGGSGTGGDTAGGGTGGELAGGSGGTTSTTCVSSKTIQLVGHQIRDTSGTAIVARGPEMVVASQTTQAESTLRPPWGQTQRASFSPSTRQTA